MRTDVSFGSVEEPPKIEITVNGGPRIWLRLAIGDLDLNFFKDPEKVLSDLRHAIRVAEDTLFAQEQAEVRS